MTNKEIAAVFSQMAKILELKGDNPFKIRAYLNAARQIENLGEDVEELVKKGKDLKTIKGIGKEIEAKIKELVETKKLSAYQRLKESLPDSLLELLEIPGLGPKTLAAIYQKLGIKDIETLEKAARSNKLLGIANIKEKTQANILKGIEILKRGRARLILPQALKIAQKIKDYLSSASGIERIEIAGSLRRKCETIGDIDILAVCRLPGKVKEKFLSYPSAKKILAQGDTKLSFITNSNLQVDLRIVKKKSWPAALLYFTGSKDFNIALRKIAQQKGYKINEYGVFARNNPGKNLASRGEEGIFKLLGLQYIPPVLRENRGEIEKAKENKLPLLIEKKDIKGDLHVHSNYSDGLNSIFELSQKAKSLNYRYLAVCDHSQGLKVARGLGKKEVLEKEKEITALNQKIKGLKILFGTEVDILSDGSLDYPVSLLRRFDIVVGAIHSGFKQSRRQLTQRIIAAIKSGLVHIIAHPTGRLFGVRDEYEIDFDEIVKAASDYQVALEINCYPQRLDLNETKAQIAASCGVKMSLGTDSHRCEHMDAMEFGVYVAQRAWLTKENVLNAFSYPKLRKWLALKR